MYMLTNLLMSLQPPPLSECVRREARDNFLVVNQKKPQGISYHLFNSLLFLLSVHNEGNKKEKIMLEAIDNGS